jgi:hypothetical protein
MADQKTSLAKQLSKEERLAVIAQARRSLARDKSYAAEDASEGFWEWAGHLKTRDEEKGVVSAYPQWDFLKRVDAEQEKHRLNIWLKPRQMFISNHNCAKRLYRASRCDVNRGDAYLGLIVSMGEREAMELMNRIWFMYQSLPDWMREPVLKKTESEICFEKGGRLLCLPASQRIGHSFTATDILLDEWSRLPHDRYMHAGLMPTIGRQGRIDGVSTPTGKFNVFAEIWHGQDSSWNHVELDWREHPDRDDEWAELEKKKICPGYPHDLSEWLQQYEKHFEVFTEKAAYPAFSNEHVDNELKFDPDETLYRSWDFGGHVAAVVFFQVVRRQVRILHELIMTDHPVSRDPSVMVNPDNNIDDQVMAVLDRTRAWFGGYARVRDFCDPQGAQVSDLSRRSQRSRVEVLQSYNIYPEYRQANIAEGVDIIRMRLRPRPDGVYGLVINGRNCPVLTDGLRGGICRRPAPAGQLVSGEEIRKDGWYEHCLAAGTMVRTLTGWVPIEGLVDCDSFWTYAYSHEEKRLVPTRAEGCHLTRHNAEVIRIEHDTGSIVLTPDHPVMMRDGSFRLAGELHVGDSLMPLREITRKRSNHRSIHLNDGSVAYEHLYIYSRLVGPLVDGCVVHHLDKDGGNNNPDNLTLMTPKEHYALHKKNHPLKGASGSTHPWTVESRAKVKASMLKLRASQRKERQCIICGETFWAWKRKTCSVKCQNRQATLCRKAKGVNDSIPTTFNHKVLRILPAEPADVYNLEVPGYLNFPANGIMVHNCHDALRYGMTGVFRTTEYKRRRGKPTRPVRHHPLTGVPM